METIPYDIINSVKSGYPTNIIIYGIDKIIQPYIYFLCTKKDTIQFVQSDNHKEYMRDYDHSYKGCIFFENENYVIYEYTETEGDFLPTDYDSKIWKVLSFEILYSKKILDIDIDKKLTHFFKQFPDLLCININDTKIEVPVIGYVGIGKEDLNEQIVLQNKNNIGGMFKRGYYFFDYKEASHYANYEIDHDEYLLKLKNISVTDSLIDFTVTMKDDKFFINNIFIGDVPIHCNKNAKYTLYYYDKDVVYLKSNVPNKCASSKEKRDGIVIRYVLFLNRHYIGPKSKKNYDSFSYNSIYMIKSTENFACISYHLI